jgi:hypothetical protein
MPIAGRSRRAALARAVQSSVVCRQAAEEETMSQAKSGKKGDGRAQARKIVDLVQREIEDGATSVEEIHKAIADLPLDVLERLDLFEEMVKGARKVQEARIGAMYDVIRKVNEEVGKIARELLTGHPEPKPGHKKAVHAHAR